MACRCWLTLLLLGGFLFSTSPVFSQSRNLKKIQVGVPAVSMGNIVIFFTKEAKLFEKHPHFTIFPGDSVEIMECLPIPGQ